MKIEVGISPSCSESVYRFPTKFFKEHAKEIKDMLGTFSSFKPTEGYSACRPRNKKEICIYCYQTSNDTLEQFLIDNKVKYQAEKPFDSGCGLVTKKRNLYPFEGEEERHGA